MYYCIETVKTIGGSVEDCPRLTLDTEAAALAKLESMIEYYTTELNAPMMREVGGWVDLVVQETGSPTGLDVGDTIAYVTVKRPLHSPSAMVCRKQ